MTKMTGREKIELAFSPQGTPAIPAVICYESIYVRDHWDQIIEFPWWYSLSPDLDNQLAWRSQLIDSIGQDWFELSVCEPDEIRQDLAIAVREDGEYRVNRKTSEEWKLTKPVIGGWLEHSSLNPIHPEYIATTRKEVQRRISIPEAFDAIAFKRSGEDKLANLLLKKFGRDLYPIDYVTAPLWGCYYLWGFEDLMALIASDSALVRYASRRQLEWSLNEIRQAAALGARGVWIEECLVDMISRESYAHINLPLIQGMAEEIRGLGMHSIYYFCGNPKGKLDLLLATGVDVLALEESKKGFTIDICEIAEYVDGRCALLGNLDAINLLPNADEGTLRAEIARQIEAGWRNKGRFVMSIGSPVTPGTSPQQVRLYTDLAHSLGIR